MSGEESVVADFFGRFAKDPKGGVGEEPNKGRIVLSRKRLVVADDGKRITIPVSKVVDVILGNVPPNLRDLFDSTITIGYENDDGTVETILIEGDDETIEKFRTVFFRCVLNGTKAEIKHPARVGGRVTDSSVQKAKLSISPERVTFRTKNDSPKIDITQVIGFDRTERSPDGTSRPSLLVQHADGGEAKTSLISPLSSRRLNLLGRFLRIEYSNLLSEIAEIDLNESEKRLLVTVYATGGNIDFANVLDGDAARATNVVNNLREKGLIEEDASGISLTSRGQVVVNQRLEDVNI